MKKIYVVQFTLDNCKPIIGHTVYDTREKALEGANDFIKYYNLNHSSTFIISYEINDCYLY